MTTACTTTSIPTAMVTLARLGMHPGLMAPVGDDVFGQFVIDELKKEGVDTSYIFKKKQPTAIASGWIEQRSGRRTIVLDLKIHLKPGDIKLSDLPAVRAVHLDGRYLPACLKIARWARRNNIPVIFDIGSLRNDVSDLIPLTDHLVVAGDFALPFTGTKRPESALNKLMNLCRGTVVVTSGTKGSLGYSAETGLIRQKAFKVKTVDTTGAGDVFHGSFIAGMLSGWGPDFALQFADGAAALSCRGMGGRATLPDMDEVIEFLKDNGISLPEAR